MTDTTYTKLEGLMEECDRLNADEKAKLLKHLLDDVTINVTVGSSQFNVDTFYQINFATLDQMAGILKVIADKISSKKV